MNIPFLHMIPAQLIGGPVNNHIPVTQMPTPIRAILPPTLGAQPGMFPSPTGIHLHIAPSSLPGGRR